MPGDKVPIGTVAAEQRVGPQQIADEQHGQFRVQPGNENAAGLDNGAVLDPARHVSQQCIEIAEFAGQRRRTGIGQDGQDRFFAEGLLGVSERSSDMRAVREAIKEGDAKARLAVDKFVWTIQKWIGSFYVELGGLDMLVLTGGIGENDIASRAEICEGLGALGILIDAERNNVRGPAVISAENSKVMVRVIPPAEDLIIVNHVVRLLAQ